jgi:predicted N-acetyltransferase YhbS
MRQKYPSIAAGHMIALFKNLWWKFNYPWPRSVVEDIHPLRISVCPESKFVECERLYDENIPLGVPADNRDGYANALRDGRLLTLIVEDGDEVVGTFGVQYGEQQGTYWLCYLLISPKHQRKGIGTTLFFTSMALLPEDHPSLTLCIIALPGAAKFYNRLGFRRVGTLKYPSGEIHALGVVYLWSERTRDARTWLLAAGVDLPSPGYVIPTAPATPSPTPSPETPTHPQSPQSPC